MNGELKESFLFLNIFRRLNIPDQNVSSESKSRKYKLGHTVTNTSTPFNIYIKPAGILFQILNQTNNDTLF